MNIVFPLKNRYFPSKFTESPAKGAQTSNLRWSLVETQTCSYCDIGKKNLWFYYIFSFYLLLWPGCSSKLSCFKRLWSCPFLKNFAPQCETACGRPVFYILYMNNFIRRPGWKSAQMYLLFCNPYDFICSTF